MMRRLACALAATLLASCGLAAPGDGSSGTAEATHLRKPDVRYEPTPQSVVHKMLRLAQVGPGDIVYDLGSGEGRIPITAATHYGARGVGIDIDPKRIAESRANALDAGVNHRVTFRHGDLLLADFREATVVTLFLSPELNRKVKPLLFAQLRPGSRVVSYYHDMPGWQPQQKIRKRDGNIYLWIIPES